MDVFHELKSDKITLPIQKEFIDWCHKYIRSFDGSDSWFESSISTLEEYWTCEGYQWISWKGDGFQSIFTILMASNTEPSLHFINFKYFSVIIENQKLFLELQCQFKFITDHLIGE